MRLLLQAIQEYLKEHHKYWTATPYECNESIIEIAGPYRPVLHIELDTKHQTITTIKTNDRIETTYTDYTLLPQITETINNAEQPCTY